MATRKRKRRTGRIRAENAPPGAEPTKPVAFRLPPSLATQATKAARKVGLSRNKYVETVLRAAVEHDTVKPATAEVQHDLFG
jgi:predicted HicB family RNase H-like nuclease